MTENNPGRELLKQWQSQKPSNFYAANPNLREVITTLQGPDALRAMEDRLSAFGETVASQMEGLVSDCERLENLPILRRWSGLGDRTEEIEFHPSYKAIGKLVWAAGMLAVQAEPGHAMEQAALFYLLAHQGEGGHACPVACTSGLIRALQQHGPDDLRRAYLPPLLDPDYDHAHVGAQFLTEVQGGSDVGANLVEARKDANDPRAWRIHGEKWFCSVANADQFLLTARVARGGGTAGLATFLVPRRLDDGSVNEFTIRRLKFKLGTRAMASGEIDFQGALAYAIGEPGDGFKIAVGTVLNTSRWINALGSTGIMRRAYLESVTYARHREAFGTAIAEFPLVRETLATMKVEEAAALASTLYLTDLIDRTDRGVASEHERALYRLIVNANKYITSIAASEVCHMAVEMLGGNGTIEDFSPVPRLLRDNIVFESWEGTHNVLVAQVLRDSSKLGLLPNMHDEVRTQIDSLEDHRLRNEAEPLLRFCDTLCDRTARSLSQQRFGATHFRRQLSALIRLFQAVRLLKEADAEAGRGVDLCKSDVAAFYIRRHLTPGYNPETDDGWDDRIDRILASDLSAAAASG